MFFSHRIGQINAQNLFNAFNLIIHFNPNLGIIVATGTSDYGIGADIQHKGKNRKNTTMVR